MGRVVVLYVHDVPEDVSAWDLAASAQLALEVQAPYADVQVRPVPPRENVGGR